MKTLSKIKKVAFSLLALPILVASVVLLVSSKQAYALTYACTWTNGHDTGIWSDPLNWSGCNGGAPQNGDSLIFNTNSLGSNGAGNITNDLTGLQVNTITIEGSSSYNYNVTGNAISLSGGITTSSNVYNYIDLPITLTGNQTFSLGSSLGVGLSSGNFNIGTYTLTVSGDSTLVLNSPIVGSGTMNYNTTAGQVELDQNSPNFNGSSVINSDVVTVNVSKAEPLGTGSLTINNGGNLQISINSNGTYTFVNAVTMAGNTTNGAINIHNYTGSGTSTIDFSGPVTLAANAEVNLSGVNADFQGTANGCGFTISKLSGASGTLSGNLTGLCSGKSSSGGTNSSAGNGSSKTSDPDTGYGTPASSVPEYLAVVSILVLISGFSLRKTRQPKQH